MFGNTTKKVNPGEGGPIGQETLPLKNAVFWHVTPCGSCKNRVFEERISFIIKVTTIGEIGTMLAVSSKQIRLLVTAKQPLFLARRFLSP
jgi:hypothetical protein